MHTNNIKCKKSLDFAREFFAGFYPDYKWDVFTCHSWLLGEDLKDILNENSNIIKFQNLFTIEEQYESDAILGYTFRWKAKREDLPVIQKRFIIGEAFTESDNLVSLRLLSVQKPCDNAEPCEPDLSDVYLNFFGEVSTDENYYSV